MFSRFSYTIREMWASLRRNKTLTAASVITSAVSLLLFGLTLLIQRGFDNQLSVWEGGVEMIVYVNSGSTPEQVEVVRDALSRYPEIIQTATYLGPEESLAEAKRLFAAEPSTLAGLTLENIPTQFKLVPTDAADLTLLQQLDSTFRALPNVYDTVFPGEAIGVLHTLRGFIGWQLLLITAFLLVSAVLLIWNTTRTAMYARRREIEVMKLVGATNWFIRLPFMLEGMLQGLFGGVAASGALLLMNANWTAGVRDFPDDSGFGGFVVSDGYPLWISLGLLLIGMIVGAVCAGTAASRFLDV